MEPDGIFYLFLQGRFDYESVLLDSFMFFHILLSSMSFHQDYSMLCHRELRLPIKGLELSLSFSLHFFTHHHFTSSCTTTPTPIRHTCLHLLSLLLSLVSSLASNTRQYNSYTGICSIATPTSGSLLVFS